jgi:hypothetical protein
LTYRASDAAHPQGSNASNLGISGKFFRDGGRGAFVHQAKQRRPVSAS